MYSQGRTIDLLQVERNFPSDPRRILEIPDSCLSELTLE